MTGSRLKKMQNIVARLSDIRAEIFNISVLEDEDLEKHPGKKDYSDELDDAMNEIDAAIENLETAEG